MLLRARIVLPITAPPLEDGAVLLSGGTVAAVGRWDDLRPHQAGPVADLGEVVLLPGLVNAHCHLDYTHLAGRIPPTRSFGDWIKAILAAKSAWEPAEFEASWRAGADQLVRHGVTTVANIETRFASLARLRASTPLRVHSFLEMTGVRSARAGDDILAEVLEVLRGINPGRGAVGLSPHAPYSTRPDLLEAIARQVRRHPLPVTMHVAESREEFDMFLYRRGPLFDWLRPQRPVDDCGLRSPVRHVDQAGLLDRRFLAVHVNYLWNDDARVLAERGASVAHCPRSHLYFHHQRFPREELAAAGVNVCVGTDSLASVRPGRGAPPELSLLAELRALQSRDDRVSPGELLPLVTTHAARALGGEARLGFLGPGAAADLAAVPYRGPLADAPGGVLHHEGPVAATLIDGQWAWKGAGEVIPPLPPA
ncbi:MAG: amidohydrolase family protein [Verrucomicrobiota bacterium]